MHFVLDNTWECCFSSTLINIVCSQYIDEQRLSTNFDLHLADSLTVTERPPGLQLPPRTPIYIIMLRACLHHFKFLVTKATETLIRITTIQTEVFNVLHWPLKLVQVGWVDLELLLPLLVLLHYCSSRHYLLGS